MNISSNEWMEITTHQTPLSMAESFISPTRKFLYPKIGEDFNIRLIGRLIPYYRSYINPQHTWNRYATVEQMKQCLKGNIDVILDIAQKLINTSKDLANTYEVDRNTKSIHYKLTTLTWKNEPKNPIEQQDSEKMSFLISCVDAVQHQAAIWSTCIIANAYVKAGNRFSNTIQPLVITKTMFFDMVKMYSAVKQVVDLASYSISGINAFDLSLYRNTSGQAGGKNPVAIRISHAPNVLSQSELFSIVHQKLLNIDAFVKANNRETIESFGGFVYRPHKGTRDMADTLRILQDMETAEKDEQYVAVEKELCNIPQELASENSYESGPIGGIEIV